MLSPEPPPGKKAEDEGPDDDTKQLATELLDAIDSRDPQSIVDAIRAIATG